MSTETEQPPAAPQPRWQPLRPIDRRVLGVLVEKAKTTPDVYPMSVNAICTGANQKNNRHPQMNLEPDDVEESLERLRGLGAVAVVQGSGRVSKYRHYLYDWLGVDKVELAVMAELLLRGAQTEGELRGRAARMEPIADLGGLRPVLDSLKAKGLVIPLTPEGRGHVVTHALYEPDELERLEAQHAADLAHAVQRPETPAESPARSPVRPSPAAPAHGEPPRRDELSELRSQVSELRGELERLAGRFDRYDEELDRLKQARPE